MRQSRKAARRGQVEWASANLEFSHISLDAFRTHADVYLIWQKEILCPYEIGKGANGSD